MSRADTAKNGAQKKNPPEAGGQGARKARSLPGGDSRLESRSDLAAAADSRLVAVQYTDNLPVCQRLSGALSLLKGSIGRKNKRMCQKSLIHQSGLGTIISAYRGYQLNRYLGIYRTRRPPKKEPPDSGGKVRGRRVAFLEETLSPTTSPDVVGLWRYGRW